VPPVPIAAFLTGALLSLLLPACMLVALVVWYVHFVRRVPDTDNTAETRSQQPAAGDPAQSGGTRAAGSGSEP
jgi:hypothetical protein